MAESSEVRSGHDLGDAYRQLARMCWLMADQIDRGEFDQAGFDRCQSRVMSLLGFSDNDGGSLAAEDPADGGELATLAPAARRAVADEMRQTSAMLERMAERGRARRPKTARRAVSAAGTVPSLKQPV